MDSQPFACIVEEEWCANTRAIARLKTSFPLQRACLRQVTPPWNSTSHTKLTFRITSDTYYSTSYNLSGLLLHKPEKLHVTNDFVQGAHHEAESLDAQCKMAYGSGAEFDGEMCDCRPGFKNVDGRCIPIEKPKRKARAPTKVGAMREWVLICYHQ